MRRPRRSNPEDAGSVLVLVLVFITVIGVLSVALLQTAGASMKNTTTTQQLERRVAAVNAGVDVAIQALRADPTLCTAVGTATTIAVPAVNGVTPTVTCTAQTGSTTVGAGGFAVFVTNTAGSFSTQGSASSDRVIAGPVANRGTWNLQANVRVEGGDVLQRSASVSNCSSARPSRLNIVTPTPNMYGWNCVSDIAVPAPSIALQTFAAAIPTPTDPNEISDDDCHEFLPGRYTSPPDLEDEGVNYFRNGVYYFDNIGEWVIDDDEWVVGGDPGPGSTRQSSIPPCATSGASNGISTGVVFILGGNSRISVRSGGKVELHSPRLTTAPTVPGPSLLTVPTGQAAPWNNRQSTVTGNTPILSVSNNGASCGGGGGQANGTEVVIHGTVYAPDACVTSGVAGTGSRLALLGGVVVRSLELQSAASVNAPSTVSALASGPGQRVVVITATSTTGDAKTISTTARLTVANDVNRTVNISSWVVSNP